MPLYIKTSRQFQATTTACLKFVNLYLAGPENVRFNPEACVREIWPTYPDHLMKRRGHQLLQHELIAREIKKYHAEARALAIARIKDWKELAPDAQQYIEDLLRYSETVLIYENIYSQTQGTFLGRKVDIPAMRLRFDAAKYILDQAYPAKIRHLIENQKSRLSAILGIPEEDLPTDTDPIQVNDYAVMDEDNLADTVKGVAARNRERRLKLAEAETHGTANEDGTFNLGRGVSVDERYTDIVIDKDGNRLDMQQDLPL